MGEHDDLHAVVGHVVRKVRIDFNHGLRKMFIPAHGERTLAVGVAVRENGREKGFVPRQKIFRELMIIHGVGVRRIGEPETRRMLHFSCVTKRDIDVCLNRNIKFHTKPCGLQGFNSSSRPVIKRIQCLVIESVPRAIEQRNPHAELRIKLHTSVQANKPHSPCVYILFLLHLFIQQRKHKQLTRRVKLMPITPTTLSSQSFCFNTLVNRH